MRRYLSLVFLSLVGWCATVWGLDTPPALDAALQAASPGDIVSLGFSSVGASNILNQSPHQLQNAGGQLLYSDDPETANGYGILYRDRLAAGTNRIYIYHVNGLASSSKITAVIENDGTENTQISYSHKSLPTPSTNYVQVGKTGVQQYYENASLPSSFTLTAGQAGLLDPSLDSLSVTQNQLVAGIYDYSATQPTTVTVLMLSDATDTLATFGIQNLLPNDGQNRQGTFSSFSRVSSAPYSYQTSDGIKAFEIASNPLYTTYDPPPSGTDAETGGSAQLKGNYGVTYSIDINVTNDNVKQLAILLNPRGGAYGGYVRTRFPATGSFVGQLVPDPTATVRNTDEAAVCAFIGPTSTAQQLTIELIPAGASSLPVHLLLVPISPEARLNTWMMY